jgi:PAS domain S-box-containing protein
MTTTLASSARSFPPEPVSAGHARRFLRSFLRDHAREDLVDTAQVALSEIVTNAVLHARTDVEVAAALLADGALRVEVTDRNPQLPTQRGYGEQATTGRGLQLVAAVAADCGVVSHGAGGKAVWFLLRGDEQDVAPDTTWQVPEPQTPTSEDGQVLLLGLPPTLWLAARQHHDAVLRELGLYAQEHPEQAPAPEVFAQADRARGIVSAAVVAGLEQRARAGDVTGQPGALPPLDLSVAVPVDAEATYTALQDLLDTAERLAASGALLAQPGLPEVVAVRDWVCEQVIAQRAGVLPSAWQGEVGDVPDGPGPPVPASWDLAEVADAGHGAVAADDGNRILAVSRPLAQLLGWAVEDLVGRRVVALVPPELREAHVAGFSRHLTTGETHVLGVRLRLPVLRADGSRVDCELLIEQRSAVEGRRLYVAQVEPVL